MLSRFITRPSSHLRLLTPISSPNHISIPKPLLLLSSLPPTTNNHFIFSLFNPRCFSSNRNNGGNDPMIPKMDLWKISTGNEETEDSIFGEEAEILEGISGGDAKPEEPWLISSEADERDTGGVIFKRIEKEDGVSKIGPGGGDEWATADGYEAWSLGEEEKVDDVFDIRDEEKVHDVFDIRDKLSDMRGIGEDEKAEFEKREEERKLQEEEKMLSDVLKGPNRAFGDLVAASGITEEMMDSLMALKDMDGVQGLPPLAEIEDMRYEKNTRKSTRAEIERQKQEEVFKARVRQVDEKGRAYGTGRRKCSIARVWIQPGDGKFAVNDKEFDVYFPMLDHRAALLRPFSETKTLGLWDINCTVKGGGVSGQVGAIQLGISRALQNWEPDLRPPLRSAGFLTRDSRVVERKKPGKAKARKSFQWVKR